MKRAVIAVVLAMGCNPSGGISGLAAGGGESLPPGVRVGVSVTEGMACGAAPGTFQVGPNEHRIAEIRGVWVRFDNTPPQQKWFNLTRWPVVVICP